MANEGQRFRNSLKNYGITFDEHVYDDHKPHLPSHVEAVREQLLDLKHILPWHAVRSAREKEQVHHELLKSLPKEQTNEIYFTGTNGANARSTLGHRPYLVEGEGGKKRISEDHGIQDHEINFMHAVLIAEDARRLNSQGGIDEATFGRRLNTYLFKRWFECGDKSENYDPLDSIVSRLDNTVLHCASEARYQVLRHSPVSFDENLLDPTKSKPDRFFAFPIHTDSDDTRSMPSRFCDQFSLTKLAGLQKFELCSCPVMDLDKYLNEAQTRKHKGADKRREPNKSAPSPGMGGTETAIFGDSNDREADERKSFNSRLLCYPWVIVELKPPGSKEAEILKCYCQALNGASSSLTLLEQLTRHKGEAHAQEPIPPILSLSFIGSEVKVWLAYTTISEVDDSWKMPCWKFLHHSTCIWEGSLRNTLDAVLLCRILDNALFWALRRLRPWIAHHLDAFYDRAQVDKPGLHSGDVIEKRKVDTMRNSDKKRLELQQWEQEIEERQQAVIGQEQSMEDQEREMKKRKKYLKTLRAELYERQENMNEQEEDIMDREDELRRRSKKADESEREVNEREVKVEQREKQAEELKGQLTKREKTLNSAEIRTKEKESGMQKHENALVEREAGCMERINECVKKEIELQHREEAFKAMETETEALITEMHFHVLKHQKKRAEARFLSSETLTITGPGGEEHAEDREKKAKSLSGFHWPRKEPGQSQDK
ncbi:golgin A6 -like 2, partial [Xylographa pallens]|nr:golgin A6 -like 2 [Xylographa pallens]